MSNPDWKPDGITPGEFGNLETGMISLREIYLSAVKAGFTTSEGIRLIAAILCNNTQDQQK